MSEASSEEEDVVPSVSSGSKNPVAADACRLLADFSGKKSLSYGDFKESWMKMQFWFVYCAGVDTFRKEEIVTSVAREGLRYLTNVWRPDHERLGGVYLMYTIFRTQPLDPKALIRVTEEEWKCILQLKHLLREKKYDEADYALHYLRCEKAFNITFTSEQKCMSTTSKDRMSDYLHQNFLAGSHSLSPHFLSSLSQEIEEKMKDYHSSKDQRKMFFPQHLLNPPQLSTELNSIVSDYDISVTERLEKFREN